MSKEVKQRISPYYLEHIKVTSFGKYANLIVGPFKSGLNVVYGENEAGKTTINELTKAVLFGWPSSRGSINAYKPDNSDRAGSLFFKNEKTGDVEELKRLKNIVNFSGDSLIYSDLDKETYETMFSLTSDELLQLDKHNDITAHLLTAGSGTLSSPAQALNEIDKRIKNMLTRSNTNPESLTNLKIKQAELRNQLQDALVKNEYYYAQDIKLKNLQPQQETLEKTQAQLNDELESLHIQLTKLNAIEESIEENSINLKKTLEAQHLAQIGKEEVDSEIQILSNLSQKEEYRLRDSIEDLDETRIKLINTAENAQETVDKYRANYEMLIEEQDDETEKVKSKRMRIAQIITSVAIPIGLILMAIYLLYVAASSGRLSFYLLGGALIFVALVTAVAGIVMNLKPSKSDEAKKEAQKKANWIVQQDEKFLENAKQAVKNHETRIHEFLDNNNMIQAHGSLRRARYMLEQARDYKSSVLASKQNRQALSLQEASLESTIANLKKQKSEIFLQVGLLPSSTSFDLEQLIAQKRNERDKTIHLAKETNKQVGEISQELQLALSEFSLSELKFKNEIIESNIKRANKQLATLFLAKNTLEKAINDWEKKSQPEVYRRASRIFELMTGGTWKKVRMNASGQIEVLNAIQAAYNPNILSLGTRQQLYLSIRISLLLTATNVGKALPIMCDDILVNFDDTRQKNAIKGLIELSQVRQVIIFTCHKEVVSAILQENSTANLIEL